LGRGERGEEGNGVKMFGVGWMDNLIWWAWWEGGREWMRWVKKDDRWWAWRQRVDEMGEE
jgi:hypothetical protein